MPIRYTLKVVTHFSCAHSLREYAGECKHLHGHNWKLEIEIIADTLNKTGMVIDFKDIKQAAHEVTATLDHRYLNEIEPFDSINPTVENIASYLYRRLSNRINNKYARVCGVTLWETDRAGVHYTED